MFTCGTCWREFPAGWRSRQQHLNATGHLIPEFECDTCDDYYASEGEVIRHMTAEDHWTTPSRFARPAFECGKCPDGFHNKQDLVDHETEEHLYCNECNRNFYSLNSIKQHLHGKLHRGSNVQCPFCGLTTGTATGLVHHIERGSCPNAPLDRDKLFRIIRSYDPSGFITNKLLGWSGSVVYEANENAYNRRLDAYECYLCHRVFHERYDLSQHLNSPVHQQKLYHCPNRQCGKQFTTLAATINHLESESCSFMRFKDVQQNVGRIVNPRRMIQA